MIISGHGKYASALKSSLELLAGSYDWIYFIDFTDECSPLGLKSKVKEVLDENNGADILFIADILGGTPFKVAAELKEDYTSLELVVGCNLTGIIEGIFSMEHKPLKVVAEDIVKTSLDSTLYYHKNKIEEAIPLDGI